MKSISRSEQELRYWLVNEDWYMSSFTREWLGKTPAREAADVLSRIAADADVEPRSPLALAHTLLAAFSVSGAVSTGPAARKAGIRAAIMLGRLRDHRAIGPLTRVYHPTNPGKYHSLIEEALTIALTHGDTAGRTENLQEIAELAERIWNDTSRRKDFSSKTADLLIAAIRALSQPGMESASGIVGRIAETESDRPNRRRVQTAAQQLLGG